ncbi:UDP-glucoronosyl and UDP-glucosyl transferase domain-containing protein [Ditylenchus destructor]|nr:UDP-glucoronosyl and UDP-glucosyl transferase domain-containing protein [Ditylenchus destructor]
MYTGLINTFAFAFVIILHSVTSIKVLFVVPNLSYSHVVFNAKLANILASNGYNVTMLLLEVDPTVPHVESAKFQTRRVNVGVSDGRLPNTIWRNPGPYEDANPLNPKIAIKLVKVSSIFVNVCKKNFRIGFAEQYDSCGFGLFHLLNIRKTIWVSATGLYRIQPEAMGVNQPLSYVPELFSEFSSNMNLWERVNNFLLAIATEAVHKLRVVNRETEIIHQAIHYLQPRDVSADVCLCQHNQSCAIKGQEWPVSLKNDLLKYAGEISQTIIANTSPLLDFAVPTAEYIKGIAGITVDMSRKDILRQEWEPLLNNSKQGFWLITFGSIAKTSEMPESLRHSLQQAFAHFSDFNFLLKNESIVGSAPEQTQKNVFQARWIPQLELIAHPKCVGLVTHGGLSSILEAIAYARPMVLMPLFADHYKNAKMVESKGLGVIINKLRVRRNTFTNAIRQISDPKYKAQNQKYSTILRDHTERLIDPAGSLLFEIKKAVKGLEGMTKMRPHNRIKGDTYLWKTNHFGIALSIIVFVVLISK